MYRLAAHDRGMPLRRATAQRDGSRASSRPLTGTVRPPDGSRAARHAGYADGKTRVETQSRRGTTDSVSPVRVLRTWTKVARTRGRCRHSRPRRRNSSEPDACSPFGHAATARSLQHAGLARPRAASTHGFPSCCSRVDAAAMRAACSLRAVAVPSRCAAAVPLIAAPTPRRLHSTPRRRKTVRA